MREREEEEKKKRGTFNGESDWRRKWIDWNVTSAEMTNNPDKEEEEEEKS